MTDIKKLAQATGNSVKSAYGPPPRAAGLHRDKLKSMLINLDQIEANRARGMAPGARPLPFGPNPGSVNWKKQQHQKMVDNWDFSYDDRDYLIDTEVKGKSFKAFNNSNGSISVMYGDATFNPEKHHINTRTGKIESGRTNDTFFQHIGSIQQERAKPENQIDYGNLDGGSSTPPARSPSGSPSGSPSRAPSTAPARARSTPPTSLNTPAQRTTSGPGSINTAEPVKGRYGQPFEANDSSKYTPEQNQQQRVMDAVNSGKTHTGRAEDIEYARSIGIPKKKLPKLITHDDVRQSQIDLVHPEQSPGRFADIPRSNENVKPKMTGGGIKYYPLGAFDESVRKDNRMGRLEDKNFTNQWNPYYATALSQAPRPIVVGITENGHQVMLAGNGRPMVVTGSHVINPQLMIPSIPGVSDAGVSHAGSTMVWDPSTGNTSYPTQKEYAAQRQAARKPAQRQPAQRPSAKDLGDGYLDNALSEAPVGELTDLGEEVRTQMLTGKPAPTQQQAPAKPAPTQQAPPQSLKERALAAGIPQHPQAPKSPGGLGQQTGQRVNDKGIVWTSGEENGQTVTRNTDGEEIEMDRGPGGQAASGYWDGGKFHAQNTTSNPMPQVRRDADGNQLEDSQLGMGGQEWPIRQPPFVSDNQQAFKNQQATGEGAAAQQDVDATANRANAREDKAQKRITDKRQRWDNNPKNPAKVKPVAQPAAQQPADKPATPAAKPNRPGLIQRMRDNKEERQTNRQNKQNGQSATTVPPKPTAPAAPAADSSAPAPGKQRKKQRLENRLSKMSAYLNTPAAAAWSSYQLETKQAATAGETPFTSGSGRKQAETGDLREPWWGSPSKWFDPWGSKAEAAKSKSLDKRLGEATRESERIKNRRLHDEQQAAAAAKRTKIDQQEQAARDTEINSMSENFPGIKPQVPYKPMTPQSPMPNKLPGHRQLPSRKPVPGPDKHPGGTDWAGQPKPARPPIPKRPHNNIN